MIVEQNGRSLLVLFPVQNLRIKLALFYEILAPRIKEMKTIWTEMYLYDIYRKDRCHARRLKSSKHHFILYSFEVREKGKFYVERIPISENPTFPTDWIRIMVSEKILRQKK